MDLREEVDRPGGMLPVVTLTLIGASWLSFLMPMAVRDHVDALRTLGSQLPSPMRLLLVTPRLWLAFVVLAVPLFVWVIARSRVTRLELRRMRLAMSLMIVVLLLAYGLAAWAIYRPLSDA